MSLERHHMEQDGGATCGANKRSRETLEPSSIELVIRPDEAGSGHAARRNTESASGSRPRRTCSRGHGWTEEAHA